ncbi:hypothetical protein [Tabrizicola oligotrophica]|uniref:Lipoprotein n=1 Tax=Tabrizicola oligotrophica TaxID=2710650 RepID=A0A6M0QX04_9RHOB|nr:hypothetical protein [Tabrizicola oligotrophica]NEY91324.1 hypothetical protein [Tabrizicola oligotrophica]
MRLPLTLALTAVMALTSCAAIRESRFNPFNWFGRSQERQTDEFGVALPDEQRPLVAQVLGMAVEQTPTGAIVRATGLSPMQGYYDAELVARPVDENGVLVYDFRLMPPPEPKPVGAERSREVTAAAHLSHIKLEGITQIVVQGAENARSSSR